MKIGVITIFAVPNYGSVLQTYATQLVLENEGCECRIINYKHPNKWHHAQGTPRLKLLSVIAQSLCVLKRHRIIKHLRRFRKQHLKFTRSFNSLDALRAADWSGYDAIAVGSDQVWNARFQHGDSAFMLSWVPDGVHRIAIASSFASKEVPDALARKYHKYLSRFDALSVREKNGIDIIKGQLGLEIEPAVLLDPTLLISKEQWLAKIPRSHFSHKHPYMLVYMLNYAFEPRPYIYDVVRHFKREKNLDVILISEHVDAEIADLAPLHRNDASVEEFIDIFANAALVITSSFHGTAFAVNLGRPLVTVIPPNSTDDRMSTLLRDVHLEQCITPIGKPIAEIAPDYDTSAASTRLQTLREQSLNWLRSTLK